MADSSSAVILTKRPEIRDVVRQALKARGVQADHIFPVTDEKECLKKLSEIEYGLLILDWEFAPDKVQAILGDNRKEYRLESHLVFLIAARDEDAIIKVAQEYYVNYVAIGEITTDTIRDQIKGLVKEFTSTGPLRKMLLAVDSCRKSGDHLNALEMLEKLYAKQGDNEKIGMELAEAYILDDRWQLAEDILRKLLTAEDVSPRVKHLFARCRLKAGDYNTAVASLKGAQLLSPYNIERLLEIGNLFLKLDRPEEAEDAFSEILDFAPGSKPAIFGQSTSKLLMGELNEALQILNGVANPRELSAIFNTAAIMAIKQQRFDAGFGLYQKALQLLSKKPKLVSRILYNMGIGYVKMGKNDKGLKCFEKASEQDPTFQDAAFNIKVLKTAPATGPVATLKETSDLTEAASDMTEAEIPLMEMSFEHGEEEVELDEVLSNISKVG
ncbi:MAG: tetratricopeptide repeat protein [Chitinophagaceae bacterium]|nr:tetratricopeptide repeat protein [Oligoflexus sp.]